MLPHPQWSHDRWWAWGDKRAYKQQDPWSILSTGPLNLDRIKNIQGLPWWLGSEESARKAGDSRSIPGWEDPLEKEMETHSSTLAWRILWTEEPGRNSPWGLKRVGHGFATKQQCIELGRTNNWTVLITVPKFIKHNVNACRDEDSAERVKRDGWSKIKFSWVKTCKCWAYFKLSVWDSLSSPSLDHFFTQQGRPPEQSHRFRKGENLTCL